jgi:hypothetical protein
METRAELLNNTLMHSLSTIQAAKTKFNLFTPGRLTSKELVSRIKICDVLLGEIRAISSDLESRMRVRGATGRYSLGDRRDYGNGHAAILQGKAANRSRQRR